ncbi:SMI1/KNR4 family protein [Streptomyces seoulensis]|uniref:SMI1/KNR4 family protein n=1 Tax=Streptomyces seoulensis TaxID=73044 RepID=UPI003C2C3FF1
MMTAMNTDTCNPAEAAALREILASRPGAVPPAGWEEVRSFEARHGIVLPEPYRTCVAEICDGLRAGPPYYGLLPLAETPSDWSPYFAERLLAEPFPLAEAWLWEEEPPQELQDSVFEHGSLLLGTDGCGMYWALIVTGPQRGQVWLIDENGAIPFGTSLMPGTPGFTGWVSHWAEGRSWFGDD